MNKDNTQEIREYIEETATKLGEIALAHNKLEFDKFVTIEKDGKRYSIRLNLTVNEF